MTPTERISQMEQRMERVLSAMPTIEVVATLWHDIQSDIAILDSYLGSEEWHADRKADEEGLLPRELKRGVLSEDALYDLICNWHDVQKQFTLSPTSTDNLC